MREDHLEAIIAQAIGQEKAQKAVEAVMQHWGGCLERIPTGDQSKRAARNQEIRRLYRLGVDIPGLAERFEISRAQVRRVVGE